jgi:dihydropteroate synthase
MREALAAEVDMINDINGFRAEGAIDAVKDSEAGLCVMHMQGQPQTMQQGPDMTMWWRRWSNSCRPRST